MVIGERGEDESEKYEREKYERGENKGGKDHIGDEDDEEMDWGSEETCEEWEPESQRKNRTKNEYEVKKMLNESKVQDILSRENSNED